MGTITTAAIIADAQILLQDPTSIRWTQAELLEWLNIGQRVILNFKPNANIVNSSVQLSAGTKQAIPADGIQLIDVVRNMGTDGNTPGNAIRIANREILDSQVPGWHSSAPSTTAKHFMFTPLNPKNYYVYPPQPASGMGYVEIIYGAMPSVATLVGNISVDDIYASTLLDYILYKAYSKDAEYAANAQLAALYYQQAMSTLTGKAAVEAADNPNANSVSNPNARGK